MEITGNSGKGLFRGHLLKRLENASRLALTLLSAPAGYGKSHLLSSWSQGCPERPVLLTRVHSHSRQAEWLQRDVFRGLSHLDPNAWQASLQPLEADLDQSPARTAECLVDFACQIKPSLIWIIDDYHQLISPFWKSVVEILLNIESSGIHIVLSGRQQPDLPLTELCLSGKAAKLEHEDFTLDMKELEGLAAAEGCPKVPQKDLAHIIQSTQGWMTGALVALSLWRRHGRKGLELLSGNQPSLASFFMTSVLSHATQEEVRLLQQAAVLECFDKDALLALFGHEDSPRLATHLNGSCFFILATEGKPGWFHFHPMFRQYLSTRLEADNPAKARQIHLDAASHFRTTQHLDLALHHARNSQNSAAVKQTVSMAFDAWIRQGQFSLIQEWAEKLDDELVVKDFNSLSSLVFSLMLSRRFGDADYFLNRYRQSMKQQTGETDLDDRRMAFLALCLRLFRQDAYRMEAPDIRCLELMSDSNDIRVFGQVVIAYHDFQHGRFKAALGRAERASIQLKRLGFSFMASYAGLLCALCHRQQNHLLEALGIIRQGIEEYENGSSEWILWSAAQLIILYEQNCLQDARALCESILPTLDQISVSEVTGNVYLVFSRILFDSGDTLRARRALDRLRRSLGSGVFNRFNDQLIQEQCRQALLKQQKNRLESLSIHHDLISVSNCGHAQQTTYRDGNERIALATIYWLRGIGRDAAATRLLRQELKTIERSPFRFRALILRANLHILDTINSSPEQRAKSLKQLVDEYEIFQFTRSVFDETPGLDKRFAEAIQLGVIRPGDTYLEYFGSLLRSTDACPSTSLDELTGKERQILQLLLNGLSNGEISEEKGIRVSTTKWHLKNIYNKLGVNNRTEAILRVKRSETLTIVNS